MSSFGVTFALRAQRAGLHRRDREKEPLNPTMFGTVEVLCVKFSLPPKVKEAKVKEAKPKQSLSISTLPG
jgi:hypothetical protein